MHAMVFNTRQKVAVLAVGLTIAMTGVVTREAVASSNHPAPTARPSAPAAAEDDARVLEVARTRRAADGAAERISRDNGGRADERRALGPPVTQHLPSLLTAEP